MKITKRIASFVLAAIFITISTTQLKAYTIDHLETARAMLAYSAVLRGYINRYGIVDLTAESDNDPILWPASTGVQFAELIRFSNFQATPPELFIVYWPDEWSDIIGRVYGFVGGEVRYQTTVEMFLPGSSAEEFFFAIADSGQTFMVVVEGHSHWTLETHFYAAHLGQHWRRQLSLLRERSGEDLVFDYFVNGEQVDGDTYRNAAVTELGIVEVQIAWEDLIPEYVYVSFPEDIPINTFRFYNNPDAVEKTMSLLSSVLLPATFIGDIIPPLSTDIGILINDMPVEMDVAPFIQDGRTFVPLRAIGEALGGEVSWNGYAEVATVIFPNGRAVIMAIGDYYIHVLNAGGGSETILNDAAPIIVDGRTMLPVRGLAEAAGFDVQWDGELQRVIITTQ